MIQSIVVNAFYCDFGYSLSIELLQHRFTPGVDRSLCRFLLNSKSTRSRAARVGKSTSTYGTLSPSSSHPPGCVIHDSRCAPSPQVKLSFGGDICRWHSDVRLTTPRDPHPSGSSAGPWFLLVPGLQVPWHSYKKSKHHWWNLPLYHRNDKVSSFWEWTPCFFLVPQVSANQVPCF